MIRKGSALLIIFLACISVSLTLAQDITTVYPKGFPGGLSNPLMGFRFGLNNYTTSYYPTIVRQYIRWNEIENNENDGVDKIINFCNAKWVDLEKYNVKVIPRVYLDYGENPGDEYWPADLETGDWKSQKMKDRVVKMIEKLGKAWDNDPRVAWVQTGIIGQWGEQEKPVGVDEYGWVDIMGRAYKDAFPNKMTIVRNQDVWEAQGYNFGVYWDSFAHPGQMGGTGSYARIKNSNSMGRYLTQVVEGEAAFGWGQDKMFPVLGTSETETLTNPQYYNYLIDVIKELHCTGVAWGYNPDPTNTVGASEVQKAFGYRFTLNEFSCPKRVEKGGKLDIMFKVKNTGSAPFYEKWPVAVVVIDETTKSIVSTQTIPEIDIRTWVPGDNYNYTSRSYSTPAPEYKINASVTVPSNLSNGKYMIGLTILEPYSRTPGVFFAVSNFLKESQTQPLCHIGIGADVTGGYEIDPVLFGDPVKDDKRIYTLKWNGPTYSLTTNAMTGGSVNQSSGTLNENQKATLKATANLGYVFSGWSGDLTGTENPAVVTMDKNKSITANFKSVTTFTLTVNAPNATVELTPSGGVYNTGTVVTILIKPNLGYVFSSWSGDLSVTTNPATITMNSNKNVTANLATAPIYKLTTNATGGSITLNPAGPQYTKGTVVEVTAKANPDYTFREWSGDPLNDEYYINPNFITMNSDKNITAIFIGPPVVTGLWVETFDLPNGTTIDTGSTAWTATRSSGIFGVVSNRLAINNAGPEGVFATSKIDISGGSVDLSVDVEGAGGLDPETSSSKDHFGIFFKVDGSAENLIYEKYGAQPATTVTKTDIRGKTLEIVIKGYTTASDEFYYFNNLKVAYSNPTGIDEAKISLPISTQLLQNYPNPFNPETTISYQLAEPSHARITIYNTLGQQVSTLDDRDQSSGHYSIRWNGRDLSGNKVSSGVYYYTLEANSVVYTKKLLLLQ